MLRTLSGEEAARGGRDLVLSLTADQVEALGGDDVEIGEFVDTLLVGLAALRAGRDPDVPPDSGMSLKDNPVDTGEAWVQWLLRDASALVNRLEGVQAAATRQHEQLGGSHSQLAIVLGVARATAQGRRKTLERGPAPAELWATAEHAPVDHPGTAVPDLLRDWSVPWPGYLPVDITPPELRPEALAHSVPDWAYPYPSPQDVPEWPHWVEARAAALIQFDVDDRRWPLNPAGRTGRCGRNLGRWGENAAADPIVVAGSGPGRRVLLIKRSDNGMWAIPGGMVDPGETAPAALVRELREETEVDLADHSPEILTRALVDDWRNTDHAWVASVVALYRLDAELPATAADDAIDAAWWPFASLEALREEIQHAGGELYTAHEPLLSAALDKLD